MAFLSFLLGVGLLPVGQRGHRDFIGRVLVRVPLIRERAEGPHQQERPTCFASGRELRESFAPGLLRGPRASVSDGQVRCDSESPESGQARLE